jgi:DNA-binding SARP family transcriptional activator
VAGAVELQVLRPDLVIRRNGEVVAVPPRAATLLVALAHAHPNPVHVERVHDILWPDRELRPNRLNTLVHRLRSALGESPEVLRRDGPLLRLDERYCDVDLWAYRRKLHGGAEERLAGLAAVRGNLCEAQLPYNEHLVEARHELLADWLRHAGAAVHDHGTRARLAEAAACLRVGDELAELRPAPR